MGTAVALGVAAVSFTAAVLAHRHRGAVLAALIRWRGFQTDPPGPRRRYQRGPAGSRDMAAPVVICAVIGTLALIVAALG